MNTDETRNTPEEMPADEVPHHPLWARMGLVVVVLVAGVGGMAGLSAMRQAPESTQPPEHRLAATGYTAARQDVQTTIAGFGTARPVRTVAISAEVAGRVESVHPKLEVGNVIPAGEVLFTVDPHDYRQAVEQTGAEVDRLQAELERLATQEANDQRRLALSREMETLSRNEYERIEGLVGQGGVESQSRLDAASSSLNRQMQEVVGLENAVELYPIQGLQVKAQLRRAESLRDKAQRDLERSQIAAPFNARIVGKSIEAGQYVGPGQQALVLADDSALDIPASLDSRDVSAWLGIEPAPDDSHRFGHVSNRPVQVRWTGDPRSEIHMGRLERIQSYSSETRTFSVVVRVDKESGSNIFPLAEGMFCAVEIPGVLVKSVYVVPRESVDYDGTLLLANEGRLQSRKVNVVRNQGDMALVDEGLKDGDVVLTTRPPKILDGLAVDVNLTERPRLPESTAGALSE